MIYVIKSFGAHTVEIEKKMIRAFQAEGEELFCAYLPPKHIPEGEKRIQDHLGMNIEALEKYIMQCIEEGKAIEEKIAKEIEEIFLSYMEYWVCEEDRARLQLWHQVVQGDTEMISKEKMDYLQEEIHMGLTSLEYIKKEYERMKKIKVFESTIHFSQVGREDKYVYWRYCAEDDSENIWKPSWCLEDTIVTSRNRPPELYSYALYVDETAEDTDLYIYVGENHSFEQEILPKLMAIDSEVVGHIEKKKEYRYVAVYTKQYDRVNIMFPDMPNCREKGLEPCFADFHAALNLIGYLERKKTNRRPKPTKIEKIRLKKNQEKKMIIVYA